MSATREDVVRVARSYIGTPYHHLGRVPGIGLDCAGVVICVGRELGLVSSDFDVPVYSPAPDGHSLLAWCDEHLGFPQTHLTLLPGHVIVLRAGKRPQHIGIVGDYVHGGLSLIHSNMSASPSRVTESRLVFSRAMVFVKGYSMPGVAGWLR
jgi:cell wall-associated NlpC family hydrolase